MFYGDILTWTTGYYESATGVLCWARQLGEDMGTPDDWIWILGLGLIWIAALWNSNPRRPSRISQLYYYTSMTFGGVVFGMGIVFKWGVLHGMLLLIFAPSATIFILSSVLLRVKIRLSGRE